MSHTTTIKSNVVDLDALDAAVKALGGQFIRNVTEFTQYSAPGHCDHVIRLPSVRYEVGVARNAEQNKYDLLYDPYGFDHSRHDGHQLVGELSAMIMGLLHDTRFLRDPRAADRTQASWDRLVKSCLP